MATVLICVKIFFARILDVTIGVVRQAVMFKNKVILTTVLAFIEVFIWFVVAKEALRIDVENIFIPIFYSLGYASGTLLGFFLTKLFIKGEVGIQIIVDKDDDLLLKALKIRGYQISIINLESTGDKPKKMLFLEVNNKSLKKVQKLINQTSPEAFVIVNEAKNVFNGLVK